MGMDERVHHLAARFPDVKVHLYGKAFRPGRERSLAKDGS
jgi:5-(carboxyamino)imidazole ribonucleotide synthase